MEKIIFGTEKIDLAETSVDPRVQRAGRPHWVEIQLPRFNPVSLGVFHVSRRRRPSVDTKVTPPVTYPPGLYIIDGWGRKQLCDAAGYKKPVLAQVYENLSVEAEAALYIDLNTKTNHRALDDFRIALVAGRPVETSINCILLERGLSIADSSVPGHIRAVSALRAVHSGLWLKGTDDGRKRGVKALEMTLDVIVKSWGSDVRGFDGALIEGIGMVALAYPTLDVRGLVERLSHVPNAGVGLKSKAAGYRDIHGGSLANGVASFVIDHYNRSRSTRRLDAWKAKKSERTNQKRGRAA